MKSTWRTIAITFIFISICLAIMLFAEKQDARAVRYYVEIQSRGVCALQIYKLGKNEKELYWTIGSDTENFEYSLKYDCINSGLESSHCFE